MLSEKLNEEDLKILNEKLANLILGLQTEVGELKEDTLLNAQHISALLKKQNKNIKETSDNLEKHIDSISEVVEVFEKEIEHTGNENYTNFLSKLLKEDMQSLINDFLEEQKRKIEDVKVSNNNYLNYFTFFLSITSFCLLMFICFKFNIFSQLF